MSGRRSSRTTWRYWPGSPASDPTQRHRSLAAWLKRSPDTATADEVRRFQLYLIETTSICNRNRIMTGVRFLFRVTLRRHDLAAEVWHIKEPERLPPVLSPEEIKRVLTMAISLKARAMLTLAYGCGLRAGAVVRLRAGGIACDREGGLGRRLHQQVIDDALVLVGDGTQLARQRVDDVKIRHRQQLRFSVGEPSASRRALTFWAMPVAARVVRALGMAARRVLAACEVPAERRRTTALDRTHYLQLLEAHMERLASRHAGP